MTTCPLGWKGQIRKADGLRLRAVLFITGTGSKALRMVSAAPVLFLKLQDETFNVGQFLMQVLTAMLLLSVAWIPLQRETLL